MCAAVAVTIAEEIENGNAAAKVLDRLRGVRVDDRNRSQQPVSLAAECDVRRSVGDFARYLTHQADAGGSVADCQIAFCQQEFGFEDCLPVADTFGNRQRLIDGSERLSLSADGDVTPP